MRHSPIEKNKWLVISAVLLLSLAGGCGDDKSTSPTPDPALSMTLQDTAGRVSLKILNSGGPMTESTPLIADYADGHLDTVIVALGANDSLLCNLSNIHGAVTVTMDEWNLAADEEDCLCQYFADVAGQVHLASFVPSPFNVSTVVLCTYTTYLNNLAADSVTTELTETDDGLLLTYIYHDISGHLTSTSPGGLCVDLSGTVTITSVVITTEFSFSGDDDSTVTLGTTEATVNGLAVTVDGTFGFIVSYVLSFMQGTLTQGIEDGIVAAISATVPADLSTLIIVNSDCAN